MRLAAVVFWFGCGVVLLYAAAIMLAGNGWAQGGLMVAGCASIAMALVEVLEMDKQ